MFTSNHTKSETDCWLFFSPNILTRIHQQKYRYYVYDQQKLLCWTDFSAGIGQPQMLDRFFSWYWTTTNVGPIFQLVLDNHKCWTDFSAGIGQPQMLDRFFSWYWTTTNVGPIFQLVLDNHKCWTDFSAGIGQPQMLDRFFCWYWTKANVIFEARN